jgi:hypothetical protein
MLWTALHLRRLAHWRNQRGAPTSQNHSFGQSYDEEDTQRQSFKDYSAAKRIVVRRLLGSSEGFLCQRNIF